MRARGYGAAVVLCVAGIVAGPTQASDTAPRKVTVKAGLEGDAKTSEAYLTANAIFVREAMPEAVRSCASTIANDQVTTFDLTITVARGGKVVGTTTNPANAFTSCVSKAVKKTVLTEPPRKTDVFAEIAPLRRIIIQHASEPKFRLTIAGLLT